MSTFGSTVQWLVGLETPVTYVAKNTVVISEHKALTVSQLVRLKKEMDGAEIEVSAYDDAQVPGDQHPQLMLRLVK
jgi:hypothetical protein